MKRWTQHDARSNQIVEADQFNDQQTAARGEATGLDRAQYPVNCVTNAMLVANARHKVWTFVPWDTGAGSTLKGEQTRLRATYADTRADQFRAVTYQDYGSGWITAFEQTLTPTKAGSLLTEWFGNTALQIFFTWTAHNRQNSTPAGRQNEHYIGLRILYNGAVVAERIGPAKPADCFRIVGEAQVPNGDVVLTCQFKATAAGVDDALEDVLTNDHLMQAHLWGNRVVCVGRWR